MGYLKKTTTKITKTRTGADFNNPSPVLKDVIHVVTSAEETSKVVGTGFQYVVGINELEVYVNGLLQRVNEVYSGTTYGDYTETTNCSVTFEDGIVVEGSVIRFRVTGNSFDYSAQNSNNLVQIGRDVFGDGFVYSNAAIRTARTIGTFTDGDTTPDVSNYRTYRSANTSTTYISDLDGGMTEDIRHIVFGDGNTVLVNGSGLNLYGNQNFYPEEGEMCFVVYNGSTWDVFCRSTISDSTGVDMLEIIDSTSATSLVVTTPFTYTPGIYNLKVFVDGLLMSVIQTVDGTNYGDYTETDSNTITFEIGVISEGSLVRFLKNL